MLVIQVISVGSMKQNESLGNMRTAALRYSATTQTGALQTRVSNHNVFWKQKVLKFFCKQTNKFQG